MADTPLQIYRARLAEVLASIRQGEADLESIHAKLSEEIIAQIRATGDNTNAVALEQQFRTAFERTAFRRASLTRRLIEQGAKAGSKAARATFRATYGDDVSKAQVRGTAKALREAGERIAGRVSVDGVSLSKRIRRVDAQTSAEMAREVERGIRQKKGILGAARKIERLDPREVRLPQYLQQLEHAARTGNVKQVKKLSARYLELVKGMGEAQADGTFRASKYSLRTATKKFVTEVGKASSKGIDGVVKKYVAERAAWRANLIARTETVNSFRESYVAQSKNKPGVVAYRWRLSPGRHPVADECFPAGTMVATPDGERAIEKMRVGDLVLTHAGECRPVRRAIRTTPREGLLRLRFRGATSQVREVVATPNHPFATARGWIAAGDLREGDRLVCLVSGRVADDRRRRDDTSRTCQADSLQNGTFAYLGTEIAQRHAEPRSTTLRTDTLENVAVSTRAQSSGNETGGWFESRPSSQGFLCPSDRARSVRECPPALSKESEEGGTCFHARRRILSNTPGQDLSAGIPTGKSDTDAACACALIDNRRSSSSDAAPERVLRRPRTVHKVECICAEGQGRPPALHEASPSICGCSTRAESLGDLHALPPVLGEAGPCTEGMFAVVSLESTARDSVHTTAAVYNLEVETDHTYFANGLLVHNCDVFANQNAYGLGPGVYPPDKLPRHPHPACLCSQVTVLDSKHFERPESERGQVPAEMRDATSPGALGWLRQNEAAAAKILGPTRHALLKDGVNVLDHEGRPRLVRDLLPGFEKAAE